MQNLTKLFKAENLYNILCVSCEKFPRNEKFCKLMYLTLFKFFKNLSNLAEITMTINNVTRLFWTIYNIYKQ